MKVTQNDGEELQPPCGGSRVVSKYKGKMMTTHCIEKYFSPRRREPRGCSSWSMGLGVRGAGSVASQSEPLKNQLK